MASPKLGGEFDFRLEKRLSKDKMTVLKILGGAWPLAPPMVVGIIAKSLIFKPKNQENLICNHLSTPPSHKQPSI